MFFLKELPTRDMLGRYARIYPEMDIDKTEKALLMLRNASILLRHLEAYFAVHNLSQTRFLILIVLDREVDTEGLSIMDIVNRLDVSKPVVTKTLKTLENDGFVHACQCENDARSKRITLMPTGRKKLQQVLPGYYHCINTHINGELHE